MTTKASSRSGLSTKASRPARSAPDDYGWRVSEGTRLRRLSQWAPLVPALYLTLTVLYLLACFETVPEVWGERVRPATFLVGLLMMVVVPLLVYRLAASVAGDLEAGDRVDRVAARRCVGLAVMWSAVGAAMVLGFSRFSERIAEVSAKPSAVRIWPGTADLVARDLLIAGNPRYTVAWVVGTELVFVIVIAVAAALVFWRLHRVPEATAIAVPFVVVGLLIAYLFVAPGAWVWDYDPFVGDVALTGVFLELIPVPGLADPVGGIVLSVATLTMAVASRSFPSTALGCPTRGMSFPRRDRELIEAGRIQESAITQRSEDCSVAGPSAAAWVFDDLSRPIGRIRSATRSDRSG